MQEQYFNSEKELRSLYQNRGMSAALQNPEEEKKQDNQYAGMNKKQR